jgi:ferrous iron transport protein B
MKTIKYALVGPPNVGKSMIFYRLVGRRVKIANYPGKTLDKDIGSFRMGETVIEISDLPGIFNAENPKDEDEYLALSDAFKGNYQGIVVVGAPHVIKESLNILRIMAKKKKVIFVLNMVDLANPAIDEKTLSSMLGVPVVYMSAAKNIGIQKLKELLAGDMGIMTDVPEINVKFKSDIWRAKLLSKPSVAIPTLLGILLLTLMSLLILVDGETPFGDSPIALIPVIEPALDRVAGLLVIPGNPLLTLFLTDGIWSGVSVVILFIPYVAAVAFFMALYEQTGLIGALSSGVEKISARFGFSPRSIVIAFMGASCNVPSMTATKVLWGKRSRILTALLIPYIPCAPRMALFIMIASVVLPSYLVPIAFLVPYFATIIAILISFIIYRFIVGHPQEVEKLPPTPIMMPNWRIVGLRTWDYLADFLKKLSLLIIATSILVWLPSVLGPSGITYDVTNSWLGLAGKFLEPAFAPIGIPWQVAVSLMGGWIFKEVVIGILAEFGGVALLKSLSVASALALMVFLAFYSSCIATLTAMTKRVGLSLTLVSVAVQLILAFIFSYVTFVLVSIL